MRDAGHGNAPIHIGQAGFVLLPRLRIRKRNNDFKRVAAAFLRNFQHERKRQFQTAAAVLADAALADVPMVGQFVVGTDISR